LKISSFIMSSCKLSFFEGWLKISSFIMSSWCRQFCGYVSLRVLVPSFPYSSSDFLCSSFSLHKLYKGISRECHLTEITFQLKFTAFLLMC
jgi:hypothetical protein